MRDMRKRGPRRCKQCGMGRNGGQVVHNGTGARRELPRLRPCCPN